MKILTFSLLLLFCFACGNKKKEKKDTSRFFPVLSYLQSQVRQLDTSMFRITKVETSGGRSDTAIIHRNEVRKYAQDFLNIPDIKNPEFGSDYRESNIYDSLLGLAVLSYLAEDEDLEVTRQEVQIVPTFGGNDKVKTIYIEKSLQDGKAVVEKKMVWEVGKYFNVRTITQKKNEPEQIHDVKIIWQDFLSN